jgi:glycosyltransferase involved in cell wall biosynthesis
LTKALRVVSGTLFFPRGGSAFVARALARGLRDQGADVTLLTGSRRDLGELGDARTFYSGLDHREVDFTPALRSSNPLAHSGPLGTAPMHPSFEDRPGASDRVFAALDDDIYERHVAAWARELHAVGAQQADVLHIHHLTPLNAAAARVAPDVPVVGHLHGTELLMLEAIADGPPAGWSHARRWEERLRSWAASCERLIVAPGNRERAIELLAVEPERFVTLPNGFDPLCFRPLSVDRRALWRRVLAEQPRGWRPGGAPGGIRYGEAALAALERGPVLVYVGRFTEVKRLSLLLEAYAEARPRLDVAAPLVLIGGHPGEWEGEHPADAIERLGLSDVFLAGWHSQEELPELLAASDLLVLPSARESFGQVLVEAMACGVPPLAAASLGPAHIIDDGETGWLFGVDDRRGLTEALVDAVNRPQERVRRARRAEQSALERFTWPAISSRLEPILRYAAGSSPRARSHSAPGAPALAASPEGPYFDPGNRN